MESNALRLEKEVKIRDFINQFLKNNEQDRDEEWWNKPQAAEALRRLAEPVQLAVSDSIELELEDTESLVVAAWSGGTDAQGLEELTKKVRERLEKIAEARKPAFEQRRADARAKKKLFTEKLEISLLFFTKDFKSRIALEITFNPKTRNSWKGEILKKTAVPITTGCTFIVYQEYHGEMARIRGISRHDSLQMPPISGRSNMDVQGKPAAERIRSTVVTVQLEQLVKLYNQVGDQLFRNNVRFGIKETFDVSKAMRKTLEEEPELFWFKNNGITLLVEDPNFRLDCPDELQLGTLEAGSQPRFSVVNGAQTITISAKYAFEQEYWQQKPEHPPEKEDECEKRSEKKDECEKRLKKFGKAQVILRVIHVPVQPEQDETDEERKAIGDAKDLANDISVSLNRQKPIRQEDIAFSTPFVQKLTEYLGEARNNAPFQLIRRGEEISHTTQLNLVDFSRARLACSGHPGKARTASSSEIMKMDLDTEALQNSDIFVEDWMNPEADEEKVFRRYYGAVWFADQISKTYVKAMKSFKSEDMNAQAAVQNGKWYFTALAVQLLNGFKGVPDKKPDFSAFDWSPQNFAERVPQAMEAFSRMVMHCAGKTRQLGSNDFKTEEYYQQLLTKLQYGGGDDSFKEFSAIIFPADGDKPAGGDQLPEKQNFTRQRITGIALGSESARQPVKAGKEALEKTVQYILSEFSPDPAQLAQCSSWLTTDPPKGNSGLSSPVISYRGQSYWIESEELSNSVKISCVHSLCELAQIPHGKVFWFAGRKTLYRW